jgi:DNA-directed RNA polymerase specialized sigma24 family protein
MNPNEGVANTGAGQFRTTHWSVVLLSAQSKLPGSQSALADLCQLYWYPLYGFVRRRGYSAEDAQDLTQGFFLDLLERKSFKKADRERGKFRTFLLVSLQNYLVSAFERANRIKRGGKIEFVALDLEAGEERYLGEPAGTLTAESVFDARWAMTLLAHARKRLRDEYVSQGKLAIVDTLRPFLDPVNSQRLPSYEEIVTELQVSLAGARTLVHRFKKRYSEILREEVARTVDGPEAVDEEIHALCEALIVSEGRLGS